MHETELFIGLLVVIAALAGAARLIRVPYPLVGLIGGLVLGVLPGIPTPHLAPQLVFLIFLPPLLYSSAFLTSPAELRRQAGPITGLAVGLVVATLVAVGVVAHALLGLNWPVAFVLGAILSPTDPVAAVSVLRSLGGPREVETILEGEALVNDGTGLTAYKVALAAVTGSFALLSSVGQFFLIALGGIAMGLLAGELSIRVRKRIRAGEIEATLSLLTPFAAYIPAESLGVSGVLAAVAAGVWVGRASSDLSAPSARIQVRGFWEILVFILESALFLLVGLEVPGVLAHLHVGAWTLVGEILAVAAVVIVVRLAYVFVVRRHSPWQERVVEGVCGIRGAVSVAAALALPLGVPHRDLVVAVTAGVVLVTLAPPSLGLAWLVERLGMIAPQEARREEAKARLAVARAALSCIDRAAERDEVSERVLLNLRERFELRAESLQETVDAPDATTTDGLARSPQLRRLLGEVVAAQQQALQRLAAEREIDPSLADRLEHEVDLEASRLEGS